MEKLLPLAALALLFFALQPPPPQAAVAPAPLPYVSAPRVPAFMRPLGQVPAAPLPVLQDMSIRSPPPLPSAIALAATEALARLPARSVRGPARADISPGSPSWREQAELGPPVWRGMSAPSDTAPFQRNLPRGPLGPTRGLNDVPQARNPLLRW